MARRFIDEEENKKKRKPAASPSSSAQSIKRQVQNTVRSMGNNRQANSVKSSQRNNTKAFQTANVRREVNQKKRESSFTPQVQTPQTSWSPVTDPVKDYFAPVPETPKRVPNQWMPVSNPELDYNPAPTYVPQSTKDIAADYFLPAPINPEPVQPTMPQDIPNAVYNGTGDFLNPYAQQAQINKTGQFVNQSGALIGSGMDRWTGNVAYGIGDIGLIGAQNYNANRVNDRTNEAGIPVEWLTEANTDPDYWRRNAIYQAAMADAARLGDNELANTTWGQLMQNLGYNLPGAVSAFATGPLGPWAQRAANMIPMAIGAYGAGLDEKSAEGYEDKFARRYGLLNALNETVFQESIDPFHATFGMPMTLQNMAGEFLQEAAGQAVEPYMNLALRDYENPQDFWDAFWATTENEVLTPENAAAALEAGKMGALGAGINAMATNPVGTIQQAQQDVDIARDVFTDEYVDLKNDLENQIKNLDAYDSPIAEDYQNAMREQVEGLRRNITNRNSDVYTDMMGGIKEQIEFLDSVGTPEAQRTRDVYRNQLETTRDQILQPGALASQNPMIQDAAKAANRDRVLDQAKQYGIREDVADAMASIANDRQIRLNLFESDDPSDQAHHGTGENADLVEISTKADDPIGELFSHEFTHDIEGSDLYSEHRNSVYDLYDRGIIKDSTFADINAVRNAVRNAYGSDKSDEYIEREVTAYATQKLFSDEDAIIALAQENPGLARRVYDSIKETISNGFGATEEELAARDKMNSIRRARDLFKRALETPQTFSLYYDPDKDKEVNAKPLEREQVMRLAPGAWDRLNRRFKPFIEQMRDVRMYGGRAFVKIDDRLKFSRINSNYMFIDKTHVDHLVKHYGQNEAAKIIELAAKSPMLVTDYYNDKAGTNPQGKSIFVEMNGKPIVVGVTHTWADEIGDYVDLITTVYEYENTDRRLTSLASKRKFYVNQNSADFLKKYAPSLTQEQLDNAVNMKNGYKFSKHLTESNDSEPWERAMSDFDIDAWKQARAIEAERNALAKDNSLSSGEGDVEAWEKAMGNFDTNAWRRERATDSLRESMRNDGFEDFIRQQKANDGYKYSKKLSLTPEMKTAVDTVKSDLGLEHIDDGDVATIINKIVGTDIENVSKPVYETFIKNHLIGEVGNFIDSYNDDYEGYTYNELYAKAMEYLDTVSGEVMSLEKMGDALDEEHFLPWLNKELGIEHKTADNGLSEDANKALDSALSYMDGGEFKDYDYDSLKSELISYLSELGYEPEQAEEAYIDNSDDFNKLASQFNYKVFDYVKDLINGSDVLADTTYMNLMYDLVPSYIKQADKKINLANLGETFNEDFLKWLKGKNDAKYRQSDQASFQKATEILEQERPQILGLGLRNLHELLDEFSDAYHNDILLDGSDDLWPMYFEDFLGDIFGKTLRQYNPDMAKDVFGLVYNLSKFSEQTGYAVDLSSVESWAPEFFDWMTANGIKWMSTKVQWSGEYGEPAPQEYREDGTPKDYYFARNFDMGGLPNILYRGGEAMPSYAFVHHPEGNDFRLDDDTVTFIANPDYFRPEADPNNDTYGLDIWSPDYMGSPESRYEIDNYLAAVNNDDVNIDTEDLEERHAKKQNDILNEELEMMRSPGHIKSSEMNFDDNLSNSWSVAIGYQEPYRSTEDLISAAKSRINAKNDNWDKFHKAWDKAYARLSKETANNIDGVTLEDDIAPFLWAYIYRNTHSLEDLTEVIRGIPGTEKVSDKTIKQLHEALEMAKTLPTDMFENKNNRVVHNKEVAQAYVPSYVEQQYLDELARQGITTYVFNDMEERAELIDRYAKKYMLSKNLKKIGVKEALARNPKRIHIPSANDFRADGSAKNLIVSHNLPMSMVRKMWENGGVVAPSLAINTITDNNQFGSPTDASAIGTKALVDPADPNNLTTRFDSWTARFPEAHYSFNKDAFIQTGTYLENLDGMGAAAYMDSVLEAFMTDDKKKFDKFMNVLKTYGGYELFKNNSAMQAVYLLNSKALSDEERKTLEDFLYYDTAPAKAEKVRQAHIVQDAEGRGRYDEWLHLLFDDVTYGKQKLLDPTTGKYKPYSLENALKIMRKQPRTLANTEEMLNPPWSEDYGDTDVPVYQQASGFNPIFGAYGGKFNSLQEIVDARGSLQTERDEDYSRFSIDYEAAMTPLIGELHDNYAKGASLDDELDLYEESDRLFGEAFLKFVRGEDHSVAKLKSLMGRKLAKCVSDEKIQNVIDVLDEAKKTLKTDLFESKPNRIVTPDEFPQLVLPASELTEQDYEWAKKYNQEIIAFDDTKDAKGPNSRDRMKMRYAQDNLFSKNIKKSVDKQTADMPKDKSLDNLKAAVQEEAEQAINNTAKRMAEGEGAGLYQNVSEDTAQRVSEQVADKATNVTYDKTKLDALSTSANSRLDKMGLEEFKRRAYDTADEISGNQQMDRTNNPFKNAVNRINNDIRLHSNIADLSLIAQELENRKTQIIDEAEKKGYRFETYTTSDGKYEVRLTSKSKHDETGQTYMTNINALNEELDNALLKLDTVGHNMGVGLREFGMFEKMSPARQLQSLEKTIEKMNRQLHKEFGGYFNGKIFNKFKNGTFEDIVLTEEFKQKYRKAKTQEERAKLIEEFGRDVAKNFPSTLGEKVSAWRYLMMLGNPVTWERNFGGNLMEQGAVSMKNGMYYLIEKALQAGGFVGKNNIDRNNAKDQRLIRYAEKNAFDTLYNDYAEFRQTKGVSQEAFFRQKGYTGALLKWLSSYKGSNLSMSSQQKLLDNLNYNVASALKDQGIKITNKGALTKGADLRKIINGAYNGANRMIMRESDLRHVNAEGGYARLSGEETKALENFFNTDKWLQEQQGNKWFDKPTGRGLEYAFNKERQEHVFGRGKVGEAVNSANNFTNKVLNDSFMGDSAFTRFRFARTMGSLLNAQGYGITTSKKGEIYLTKGNRTLSAEETKQVLDEYKGEALQEAKESVYRNFNAVAQWINKGRRVPGLGLVLDAAMPFTTTPMNIVSQAVQYSPAGLLYALNDYNGLSSGERTPQQFINHLAKSFTGSALMGVGYLLSQLGALRGFNDDDDKEKKYKKQLGWQDYSLVWNHNGKEHSYTVDWLAPGITPLLMGAAINETLEANGGQVESGEMLFSLFESLYQPIADTTMLEGLMNTFSAFGEKHPIREAGKALITSYAGQFTPTLGARLNKIFDDTARTTYSSNFYENILLQAENKLFLTNLAYKQITGEALLEPQLNAKGEEVKNTGFFGGGTLGRALYNLGSPGKYSTNTADNYDNELLRLYESEEISSSAKNNIIPSQIYSIGGEGLKPEERTELNKYFLQNYRGQLEDYMNSPMYTAADDATRAKMLSNLKDYYYAKTKERYYGSVSPDAGNLLNKTQKTVSELEKMGVAPYQSLAYSTIKSDTNADGDTIKNSKALKVRQVMELEGNYDTVLKLIEDGKIAPGDVGLNKTVVGMDRSTFTDSYDALADGMYTGNSTDSDGASPAKETKETATKYSTKKTSSGRKTRTSSGRRRSSGSSRSTTTDMDKLYQKLYKMAMSGALDSIGDLASQFSKQAQTTYGPKREQTNHEALISELEKMVAQQKKRPN